MAKSYLDMEIDFCVVNFDKTIVNKAGDEKTFYSPSLRYEVKPSVRVDKKAYFYVVDTKTGRILESASNPFRDYDFKWTQDERFLVHSPKQYRDDWGPGLIYITDLESGQTILLDESAFYECGLNENL